MSSQAEATRDPCSPALPTDSSALAPGRAQPPALLRAWLRSFFKTFQVQGELFSEGPTQRKLEQPLVWVQHSTDDKHSQSWLVI